MLIPKSLASVCVASAIVLTGVAPAAAQEMKAAKRENVNYHGLEFIKFKEGGRERAGEIVMQYFDPAARESNTSIPAEYHMQTGEWDYVMVWPMAVGDLEWETHPDTVAWMAALNKRAGGEAQAKKLLDEWNGLIARRETAVAHSHKPAK